MNFRLMFWTIALAYTLFLIAGRGSTQVALSLALTAVSLGAAAGFVVGAMFSQRAARQAAHGNRPLARKRRFQLLHHS